VAKLAKMDHVIAEVTAELVATKRAWGALSGRELAMNGSAATAACSP